MLQRAIFVTTPAAEEKSREKYAVLYHERKISV